MYLLKPNSDVIVIDVETTGVDPEKNAVVSIAAAVCDVAHNIRAKRVFTLRPHDGAIIEPKAMEVNGLTELEIMTYPPAEKTLKEFNSWLFANCSENPRFALWYAWGVGFDDKFLFKTFERAGVEAYARRIWVCMRGLAIHLNLYSSLLSGGDKTETKNVRKFCEMLGTEFEGREHDPLADVVNSIKVLRLSMARLMRAVQADTLEEILGVDSDEAVKNAVAGVKKAMEAGK